MIINKISKENYRKHHASIMASSNIQSNFNLNTLREFSKSNFKDRGSKWHLSKGMN